MQLVPLFLLSFQLAQAEDRVSLQLEWINVPNPLFEQIEKQAQDSDHQLRKIVQQHIVKGQAEVVELTLTSAGLTSKQVTTKSARHLVFPTEWDPPISCNYIGSGNPIDTSTWSERIAGRLWPTPTAFEENPLGTNIVFTVSRKDSKFSSGDLDVKLEYSLSKLNGYHKIQKTSTIKGATEIKFPKIQTQKNETHLVIKPNKFSLIQSFHPRNEKNQTDVTLRTLVFLRAQIKN